MDFVIGLTELQQGQKEDKARYNIRPIRNDEHPIREESLRDEGNDGGKDGVEREGPRAASELIHLAEIDHIHNVDGDDGSDGMD